MPVKIPRSRLGRTAATAALALPLLGGGATLAAANTGTDEPTISEQVPVDDLLAAYDSYYGAGYTYEELIDCGNGITFGEGNAKLPLPPMLMFDRIVSITSDGGKHGKGQIIAELDIRPDLWFFDCHFKGDPVMPGCLGLDAMWQLIGFFLGWSGGPGRGRARSPP